MKILIEFEKKPLYFQNPRKLITCRTAEGLPVAFEEMEKSLGEGLWLAGFFSFEAGYGLEKKFSPPVTDGFPLLLFGCYEGPEKFQEPPQANPSKLGLSGLRLNLTREEYGVRIETIRNYIASGDVYQITFCIKLGFDFEGDAYSLYRALEDKQPVPYPAFIETGEDTILSLSPELFLKKTGKHITTKPMKGTWQRGKGFLNDLTEKWRFQRDEKNRAENVMIADLLRNDLGRVGKRIRAPRLFEITPYRTLFQMTSTVTGLVEEDLPLVDLFRSVFPSGSVTGAPKIRAMEIIREVEREKRNIYTGAIGYIKPNKDLFFNIPIRTLRIRKGRGEMGIGGGIVWDSTAQGEWEEGLLKARFFTDLAGARERELNK